MVERFDGSLGDLSPLGAAQRWVLAMHFREPRIVDLQDEASINDRLVLGSQGVAYRLEIFFVAAVVLVRAGAVRRHGRHESLLDLQTTERGLEIFNIFPDRLLPAITNRPGAHHWNARRDASAHHAPAEVLFIVLGKS